MNQTIYIDVLFLLNLIPDYIILHTTAFLTGAKILKARQLIASIAAAIYSVIIFFPSLKILNIFFIKITFSFIVILIAFKYQSFIHHLKLTITYYLLTILYGGSIYAFYNFTVLGSKMNYSNGVYYIDLPLWIILLITFAFYFLVRFFTKISDSRTVQKNIKEIKIFFQNKSISVNALFDTGNSLYDPISLLPVILVESQKFKGKLCENIINKISESNPSDLPIIHNIYPEMKFRIIPFKDISGRKTVIFAFKPDKVTFTTDNTDLPELLIGIINTKLSQDNSYQALLHSKT